MDIFECTFDGFEIEEKPKSGFIHYRWPSGKITSVGLYRDDAAADLWIEVSSAVVVPFLDGTDDVTRYYVGTSAGELGLLPIGNDLRLVLDTTAEIEEIDETDFDAPVHIAVEHFYDQGEVIVRLDTLFGDCEIKIERSGVEQIDLALITAQGVRADTLVVDMQTLFSGIPIVFSAQSEALRLLAPKVLPMAFRRTQGAALMRQHSGRAGFVKADRGVPAPLQIMFSPEAAFVTFDPDLGHFYRMQDDIAHVMYVAKDNPSVLLGGFVFSPSELFDKKRVVVAATPPPVMSDVLITMIADTASFSNIGMVQEKAGFSQAEILQDGGEGASPLLILFTHETATMLLRPFLGDICGTGQDVGHVLYVPKDNPAVIVGGFPFSVRDLFEDRRIEMEIPPLPPGANVFVAGIWGGISFALAQGSCRAGFVKAEGNILSPLQIMFAPDMATVSFDPALGSLCFENDVGHVMYVSKDNPAVAVGGFSFSVKDLFEKKRLDIATSAPNFDADVLVTAISCTASFARIENRT